MKLKIRQYELSVAKPKDSIALLSLAEKLYKNTPYGVGDFDFKKVQKVIDEVINGDTDESIIICLHKDDILVGALGATIFNPLWNDDKIAYELFFFAPNSGMVLLVDAYEEWARKIGCAAMQIGIDHSKRRLFRGFIATEQMYTKRLI